MRTSEKIYENTQYQAKVLREEESASLKKLRDDEREILAKLRAKEVESLKNLRVKTENELNNHKKENIQSIVSGIGNILNEHILINSNSLNMMSDLCTHY